MRAPAAARRGRLGVLITLTIGIAAACAPLAPRPAPAPTRRSVAERDLLDLVPAPAEAVLWVDVVRLRGSVWSKPVFAWAVERQRTSSGRQGFRGFDEIVDVDRWVFARTGPVTLELAEGRFDRKQVEATFRAKPTSDLAFAFLAPRRVVLGPPPAVRAASEVAADRGQAASDERWLTAARAALEDEAGPRRSEAAIELLVLPTAAVRQELASLLGREPRVAHLAARLVLGSQARLTLVAVTSDRQEARLLGEQLALSLRALGSRRSLRALGLGPAVERARVTARGARLVLELVVTAAEREGVADRLAELAEILGRSHEPAAPPASLPPESEVKEPPSGPSP